MVIVNSNKKMNDALKLNVRIWLLRCRFYRVTALARVQLSKLVFLH
jgi:hypothetical protein